MKAINTHIDSADVCEQGCGTLESMIYNNSEKTLAQHTHNEMNS